MQPYREVSFQATPLPSFPLPSSCRLGVQAAIWTMAQKPSTEDGRATGWKGLAINPGLICSDFIYMRDVNVCLE